MLNNLSLFSKYYLRTFSQLKDTFYGRLPFMNRITNLEVDKNQVLLESCLGHRRSPRQAFPQLRGGFRSHFSLSKNQLKKCRISTFSYESSEKRPCLANFCARILAVKVDNAWKTMRRNILSLKTSFTVISKSLSAWKLTINYPYSF